MKHFKVRRRVLSVLLSAAILVGMLPLGASAAAFDSSVTGDYFTLISKNEYALAPGAVETEMVLNNAEGSDRKVVHVIEVDTTNENVDVLPGYYQIDKLDPENLTDSTYWTAQQLTKTVDYYENTLGYNVVGSMNTALAYDSNAPYGYMVWDGVVLGTPEVHKGAQTYLAINKDGTAELRSMSEPLTGNEKTAVSANFGWLVKDGALVTTTVERTSSDASRSMLGIKADGTLVICQVDGRNAPTSTGLSNYEMGEMMLALGCVNAVNGDGGGSSTFITKREGTTENVMRSVPSDGSERPTINSIMVVSKAAATGVFDHAVLESAYDYIAPGATLSLSASGVDTAGHPMDVPAEVTWAVDDEAMGSAADGRFTAGSSTGEVTVQMLYNGSIVGEKTLNVVHPDAFGFTADSTVIPYGKSVDLEVEATYGTDSWAVCVDGAYTLALSDPNAAALNGSTVTAPAEESISGVDVTVTYTPNTEITDVIAISFGKGSEIIFDFEDGNVSGWKGFVDAKQWSIDNEVNNTLVGSAPLAGQFNEQISSTTFLASKENGGQVKNGQYALAWSLDNTDADFASWSYNVLFYVGEQVVLRDTANDKSATKLGMWLYIPENAAGLAFQSQLYDAGVVCKQAHFTFTTKDGAVKNLNSCTEADIPESRWVYASIDLTAYDFIATPKADDETNSRSPSIIRTYVKPVEPAVITFYIDDITLDYSDAVEDRVLPTISDVSYATADTSAALEDGAELGSTVSFSAKVADNAGLNNATGTILVDGVSVNASVAGSVLSCGDVQLNPGAHTVTFEIQDKLGNLAKVTRDFTVPGDAPVVLTGHNESGTPAEADSVYYADIQAAAIENIDSLTATVYLQTANTWEPEGIQVADGFEAEVEHDTVGNKLNVTVKRVGESALTGTQTLLSLPIRVWSWNGVNNVTGAAITPESHFKGGNCPIVQIRYAVEKGEVQFVQNNGKLGVFGGSQTVDTNLNDTANPWHVHDEELTAMEQAATCTEDGYTGRTYCTGCASVIDWGETAAAAGHSYTLQDGVLQCTCGELFTGEMDGVYYVDGVAANGWAGNSYYVDGVALTGIQKLDGYYYDLGEDGICADRMKYTGLFEENGKTFYSIGGNLVSGWQMIGDSWYYFYPETFEGADGRQKIKVYFNFTDGKLDSGIWYEVSGQYRYWYGPDYYRQSWATVDGEDYYFGKTGYRYTGYQTICPNLNSRDPIYQLFLFDENGVSQGLIDVTGVYNADGDLYYLDEGTCVYAKLVKDGEDYYYFASDYKAVKDVTRYVAADCTNGLLPAGYYTFGADGKLVTEPEATPTPTAEPTAAPTAEPTPTPTAEPTAEPTAAPTAEPVLNGIVDGCYYVDGVIQKIGLFKLDGAYYYASTTNGKLAVDITRYVAKDCIDASASDMKAGYYTFGTDYKMVVEAEDETKNGIIDGYYYVDGVMQKIGLFKLDGAYYYASTTNGKLAVDITRYVAKDCIDASASDMKAGYYTFGTDYKMVVEAEDETKNGIIDGYYYVDGVIQKIGLFKLDGAYYYASTTNGKLAVDITRYVAKDCIDASASDMKAGYYTFGADYKVVLG